MARTEKNIYWDKLQNEHLSLTARTVCQSRLCAYPYIIVIESSLQRQWAFSRPCANSYTLFSFKAFAIAQRATSLLRPFYSAPRWPCIESLLFKKKDWKCSLTTVEIKAKFYTLLVIVVCVKFLHVSLVSVYSKLLKHLHTRWQWNGDCICWQTN